MKQIKPILAVAVFVFALGASTTSYVGDKENIARLTGEVLTLQKQMRDLQESFDKNSGQSTVLLQKMSDNSETTVRTLAQIEDVMKTTTTVQTNSSTGVNARITKLAEQQGSTDQKLNNISTQINALKNLMEQQQKQRVEEEKKVSQAPVRFDSPDQLYAYSYSLYSQGKFEEAVTGFRRYLEAYSTTEAADNAQFWVAEALFAQNKYADALNEYDRLISNYPNGDKVVAGQFKKGVSLLFLERREEGVNALRNVIAIAPSSNEAAQAKQELDRLGESSVAPAQPVPSTGKPKPRPRK